MASAIDGTVNFRDVGGIRLGSGGTTRPGVLYRSDALAGLTETGLGQLAATPIGVVVDFRTDAERAAAPDRLPVSRPFRSVPLSILEGALTGAASDAASGHAAPEAVERMLASLPTLGELYTGMLAHGAEAFADVARLVADSEDAAPTAVLVHCTAGKDRTGVAVALLLDAVGARRDAIVADYASSAANLGGDWAERMLTGLDAMGVPRLPAIVELVTASPPGAIESALAWVDARGGSTAYLREGGLDEAALERLRARLAD